MGEENKIVQLDEEELQKVTGGGLTEVSFDSLKVGDCMASFKDLRVAEVQIIEGNIIHVKTAPLLTYSTGFYAGHWSSNTSTMQQSDLSGYNKCLIWPDNTIIFAID